jgi:PAS domain S-box-containing protein
MAVARVASFEPSTGATKARGGAAYVTPESGTTGVFSPRIVDSLVDAIVIIDDHDRILYANPAVNRLLGWPVESLFGADYVDLLPQHARAAHRDRFKAWMTDDPPPPSEAPNQITMLCADQSARHVDSAFFVVAPQIGPRMVIAVLWDVSGRVDIDRYQRVADELLAFLAGASGTVGEVVPQLLATLAESMDFEFATAWRWDPLAGLLRCTHVWRRHPHTCEALATASTGMTVQPGEGLAGLVVSSNEPMWNNELTRAPHLKRHRAIVADGMQSAFVFPIRARGGLVGVIELFTEHSRQPDPPFVEAVAAVCAQLGEFIERLDVESQRNELLVQLEASKRRQDFLLRANRALAGAVSLQDAINRLAGVAVPALGDICLIDVVTPRGTLERLAAKHADVRKQRYTDELGKHSPDIAGSHPSARAVRSGQSQWSADMSEGFMRSTTQGDRHYEITRLLEFDSYVSVPLLSDHTPIGALTLISAGSSHKFGPEELALAESLAGQVASVIGRAQLFDEQSAIAHLLQHSLLPVSFDDIPGITVAARYVPSTQMAEVGGDFYDVIALDEHLTALVIGDVEGHDVTAATVMGQLRSALRAYLMLTSDPGRALVLLDSFASSQPIGRLATACLAVLDARTGSLEIASAGHPPPYLVAHGSPPDVLAVRPGAPLGVGTGRYPSISYSLESPAHLVFYTDGLIAGGRGGYDLPLEAFPHPVIDSSVQGCEELADAVLSTMAGSEQETDDIAVLVVGWQAVPTRP